MNNNFINLVKRYKILWVLGIVVVMLLVVLFVTIIVMDNGENDVISEESGETITITEAQSNGRTPANEGTNDAPESAETEQEMDVEITQPVGISGANSVAAKVTLGNPDFLNGFIDNGSGAKKAQEIISSAVVEMMGPDASGTYTSTVAGRNIAKEISFPYSTLTFIMPINDENSYIVQVALIKNRYYGMTVANAEQDDGGEAKFYINYLRSPGDAGFDENKVIADLTRWAQNSNPNLVVTQPTIYASY